MSDSTEAPAHGNKVRRHCGVLGDQESPPRALGETAGDALSMTLNLASTRYSTGIFFALFAVAVMRRRSGRAAFTPSCDWTVIVATTTVGTTMADLRGSLAGHGYIGGLFLLLGWCSRRSAPVAERGLDFVQQIAGRVRGLRLGDDPRSTRARRPGEFPLAGQLASDTAGSAGLSPARWSGRAALAIRVALTASGSGRPSS